MGQQFIDILQAHRLAVEQVLVAAIAIGATGNGHFAEIDRQPANAVIKGNRHRSHTGPRTLLGTGENHIFGLFGAQQVMRLLAEHPAQRIGNIRFARAVRADNRGDTIGELKMGARGEGFVSV